MCVCVCRRGARSLSQNGRSMLIGTLGTPVICQNHNLAALVGSRRAARSSGSSVRSGGLYCAALVASMRGRPCAAAACSSAANILAASAASAGAAAAGSGWFCVVLRVLLLRPGPHSYWGRRGAGVCLWGGVELPEARSPTVLLSLRGADCPEAAAGPVAALGSHASAIWTRRQCDVLAHEELVEPYSYYPFT